MRPSSSLLLAIFAHPPIFFTLLKEKLLFVNLSLLSAYFDDWHTFITLPHENRLFNVVHGDGKPFTEQETEYLVIFFANHSLPIFWKSGWIAILDNERLTHARPSFTLQEGETRKLGAMMGIPKNRIGAKFQNEGKFNGLQLLS